MLMYAAINLDDSLISVLLEYNADPELLDREKKSALFYALDQEQENISVIDKLKKCSDLKFEGPNSMNSLFLAIKRNHVNSLSNLLEYDPNLVDITQKNSGI